MEASLDYETTDGQLSYASLYYTKWKKVFWYVSFETILAFTLTLQLQIINNYLGIMYWTARHF